MLHENYASPRADRKRSLKKLWKNGLKQGSSFLSDSVLANRQNGISNLSVITLTQSLTTLGKTHFVGLKFQFISSEKLSSFVILCSAGWKALEVVFYQRGWIYMRTVLILCFGKGKATAFSVSRVLHYALQTKDIL